MNHIRIQNGLQQFRPFLLAAAAYIPLSRISCVRIVNKKNCRWEGEYNYITKTITIYNPNSKTLEEQLHVLAHELAHVRHEEHTPEHFILMGSLLQLFGTVLKQLGEIDYST